MLLAESLAAVACVLSTSAVWGAARYSVLIEQLANLTRVWPASFWCG